MSRQKQIEIEAYGAGINGLHPQNPLAEINADFARRQENARYDATDSLKQLEAEAATLQERLADLKSHWHKLDKRDDELPPQIARPLLAVLSAAIAVGGEIVLISPVLQGLGIVQTEWQLFCAAVLVISASGLCELTINRLGLAADSHSEEELPRQSTARRLINLTVSAFVVCFTLALIFVLGQWRASELIFSASLQPGALGRFLNDYATLSRWCVTLLTAALPIYAAVAFAWGFAGLRLAREWRRARRALLRVSRRGNEVNKQLEAAREKSESRIALLEAEKQQCVSIYLQNHELGTRVGARRETLWLVVWKIVVVTLLICVGFLFIDPASHLESAIAKGILCTFATLALGGLYAYFALKSWDCPSPEQLYKRRPLIRHEDAPQPATSLASDTIGQTEPVRQESQAEALRIKVTAASNNGNHHFQQERSL